MTEVSQVPANKPASNDIDYRQTVTAADRQRIRTVVERAAVFSPVEIDIAVELVDERLAKGPASGYYFVFAERSGNMLGYTCYGPICGTVHSFDLYWIAVDPSYQQRGVGTALLAATEPLIWAAGAQRIYVDTSGRDQYRPARTFYESHGYQRAAVLTDFYAPGDDKVIYLKVRGFPAQGDPSL